MLKRILALALTVTALAAAPGCADDDSPMAPTANARVRVLHASPDAPAVDVLVDGSAVLSNVTFKQASGYLDVPAGARNLKVRASGTSSIVIDVTPTLVAGTDYTVIASGLLAAIQPLLLTDDNTAPAAGNVKVRLAHGAPSAPLVDIYVTAPGASLAGATPNLTDVPFGIASGYLEVPAGSYQVRICPANTTTVAIDSGTLVLAAGQIRTAVAVDNTGGGAPFGAVLLADKN